MRNPHHPQQSQARPLGSTNAARVRKPSTADQIVQLINDSGAELFHDPEDRPWVTFPATGHHETSPVDSVLVKQWAAGLLYTTEKKVPSEQAIGNALRVLAHRARTEGPEHPVYLRVARDVSGTIYLDLADDDWRVVKVTADGWEALRSSPVRFYRTPGMLPLPSPKRDGRLDLMRPFLNLGSDQDWVLIAAWMVQACLPGPYPILLLLGEQGTAKSTAARLIRSVIDPHVAPLLALQDRERDLLVGARSCHVSTYDNLSGIRGEIADALCRLATGGGLVTRRLYTDTDTTVLNVMRPILITAIAHPTGRPDFLDRALCVTLPPISEDRRRPEVEVWGEFEHVRAQVLGGLLDLLQTVLQNLPSVHLTAHPRLADFARIGVASAPAMGVDAQMVLGALGASREEAVAVSLEGSLIAELVQDFARAHSPWQGTASELLEQLRHCGSGKDLLAREFPSSPKALANALRRIAPALRATGVQIEWMGRTGHENRRCLRITSDITEAPSSDEACPKSSGDNGQRAWIFAMGQALGFPELRLGHESVLAAGEEAWRQFITCTTRGHEALLNRAITVLKASEETG